MSEERAEYNSPFPAAGGTDNQSAEREPVKRRGRPRKAKPAPEGWRGKIVNIENVNVKGGVVKVGTVRPERRVGVGLLTAVVDNDRKIGDTVEIIAR